ncbi:hypothetical protein CVT24_002255 [Panaeolus cyanescens]|uniref:Uncharacterized protein n=1 Tax=Panaeolus cyanescens TaxID=181874 RepID=A0A409WV45_9AGAR|nr:hypothetical protein CVT24_002255 [Panaeolus cyanescens]
MVLQSLDKFHNLRFPHHVLHQEVESVRDYYQSDGTSLEDWKMTLALNRVREYIDITVVKNEEYGSNLYSDSVDDNANLNDVDEPDLEPLIVCQWEHVPEEPDDIRQQLRDGAYGEKQCAFFFDPCMRNPVTLYEIVEHVVENYHPQPEADHDDLFHSNDLSAQLLTYVDIVHCLGEMENGIAKLPEGGSSADADLTAWFSVKGIWIKSPDEDNY